MTPVAGLTAASDAVNEVTMAFNRLAGTMRGFVEAFSPSAVLMFNMAMRDLNAVIGSAILPAFNLLTAGLRGVASILLPLFEALRPVIARVVQVFSDLLSGGLATFDLLAGPLAALADLFAGLMAALSPVLKLLGTFQQMVLSVLGVMLSNLAGALQVLLAFLGPLINALGALAPLWSVFSVVMAGLSNMFRAFAQWIAGFLGRVLGLQGGVEIFKDAMRTLAKYAILAAAALANMLGLKSFTQGMIAALGGARKSAAGFAAPQDARVQSDIMAFARQMAEQAAMATPGGPGAEASAEEAWRAEVLTALLTGGPEKLKQQLIELIPQLALAIADAIRKGSATYAADVAGSTKAVTAATSVAGPVGGLAAIGVSRGLRALGG